MHMSSGRRFSLGQLMVESGRLEPEQTLNHRAWGSLSVLSASRKDVLAAQIGEFEDLTTYEMGMLPCCSTSGCCTRKSSPAASPGRRAPLA